MMKEKDEIRIGRGEKYSGTIVASPGEEGHCSIVLDENSEADILLLVLPGVSASRSFDIRFNAPGASLTLNGIYLSPDGEKVSINARVSHQAGGCTSRQMFKGIVSGYSRAVFDGRIIVSEGAARTEAFQENHSLILSDTAKVETRPQLEIYADDVKCSHGATIGKLDEEEQFYMRSRGIPEKEAKLLQMISFVTPVLDCCGDSGKREELLDLLEKHIREGFGL